MLSHVTLKLLDTISLAWSRNNDDTLIYVRNNFFICISLFVVKVVNITKIDKDWTFFST